MTWALLKRALLKPKGQIFCCSGNRFCNFHTYLHALPCFCHHSSSTEGQTTAEHRLPLVAKLLVSMLLLKELLPYKENQFPAERKKKTKHLIKLNSSYKVYLLPNSAWQIVSYSNQPEPAARFFLTQACKYCFKCKYHIDVLDPRLPVLTEQTAREKKNKQKKSL